MVFKFRGSWLIISSTFASTAMMVWTLLYILQYQQSTQSLNNAFCVTGEWIVWLCYPLFILPFLLHAYRLLHIFNSKLIEKVSNDQRLAAICFLVLVLVLVLVILLPSNLPTLYPTRYWRHMVIRQSYLLKILFALVFLSVVVKSTLTILDVEVDVVGKS